MSSQIVSRHTVEVIPLIDNTGFLGDEIVTVDHTFAGERQPELPCFA